MNWRYRNTVLLLLMGAFFSTMVARLSISPLVPDIIATFQVSKGAVGLALTGMWAAYALMQLPGGVLADRYGERPVILAAIALTGLASALLATSPAYLAFVAFTALLGAGTGLYFPAATSLLTKLYRNTGQAIGFHISGGDSAGLVTPALAVYVGLRYGWHAGLALGAVVALPVLALAAWRIRATPPTHGGRTLREQVDLRVLARLLTNPAIAYTILLAVILAFTFQATLSFFPTFLVEYWGVSTARASLLFAGLFALWILTSPLLGRLSDVVGRDAVLALATVAMAVGIVLLLTVTAGPLALLGVAFLGGGMGWGGVIASRFMDNLSEADGSTGYGLVRLVYVLLGSLGSVVTGALADASGWPVAFGLVVVLLLFAGTTLGAVRLLALDL